MIILYVHPHQFWSQSIAAWNYFLLSMFDSSAVVSRFSRCTVIPLHHLITDSISLRSCEGTLRCLDFYRFNVKGLFGCRVFPVSNYVCFSSFSNVWLLSCLCFDSSRCFVVSISWVSDKLINRLIEWLINLIFECIF